MNPKLQKTYEYEVRKYEGSRYCFWGLLFAISTNNTFWNIVLNLFLFDLYFIFLPFWYLKAFLS